MKRILRNFAIVLSTLVLTVALAGGVWVQDFLSGMSVSSSPRRTQTVIQTNDHEGKPTTVTTEVISEDEAKYYDWDFGSDYINVLCVGMDTRDMDSNYGLTDVMMIASLDLTSQRIRLVSIMRDIYVNPSGYSGHTKMNGVYSGYGGIDSLVRTINDKFGANVSRYAIVNFYGLGSIIDRLGGIMVDVKQEEINQVNGLQSEVYKEETGYGLPMDKYVTEPGYQLLDGHQAVAYARIRKIGNGDFERTQRQRIVMEAMLAKVKEMGILSWPSIFNDCQSLVRTNMSPDEILAAGIQVLRFKNVEIEQLRIPVDGSWNYDTIDGLSYVVINYNDNKNAVQQFLAGEYVPPENQ